MRNQKGIKYGLYYEEVKENNKVMRKVTRADRAYDWIDNRGASLTSASRHLFRTARQVIKGEL